jgi:acyl-coenzyme A thioesterase PaaI-like protein
VEPDADGGSHRDDAIAAALDLVDATRDLADRVWRSLAPPAERAALAADIRRLAARLDPLESTAPVATPITHKLPGRGHPLLPPLIRRMGRGRTLGTVTYTSAHAGAGPAVHGGHIALLFDEILGNVAASATRSRTASMTINYRSLTLVGVELTVEGWLDRAEGRKIHVRGRLLDGARLCADADALFVAVEGWS